MAFRLNELGHGLDHGIVFHNNPISDMCMVLGMTRNAIEGIFRFVPRKPMVKIEINTNIHACTKNWHNSRRSRVLKAKP
jgi:hypothetical protein